MDITDILINSIEKNIPVSFSKYGDGEYECVNFSPSSQNSSSHNCDKDNYTEKKKNDLYNSFIYVTTNEKQNNFIGLWHNLNIMNFWNHLVPGVNIKWAKYHSLFLCDENIPQKIKLYKSIKESSLKKIIVCNPLLVKAKILFNIDYMIHVNFNNWFESEFENIIEKFKQIINPNEQYIIMTCSGMGSKVLICELIKIFPNNIYLDFGSALDYICTKKKSRGWEPEYAILMNYLREIIPENWNDVKYDYINNSANQILNHINIK
jgi:hypothetical protein